MNENDDLKKILSEQSKDVLSFSEAVNFMDVSESFLYKMTSTGQIPYYKPSGKKIYFEKADLLAWMRKNRQESKEEMKMDVRSYLNGKIY